MTVVIIGNGSCDKELGSEINKFDTVVRFKKFVMKGFEKHVGTKTDVIAWNLGHLIREDVNYCKKKIGKGKVLVHRPYIKYGQKKKLSGSQAKKIKKFERFYNSDFKMVSMSESEKIYNLYKHYFGSYKKRHLSTGLFFILHYLHFGGAEKVSIAGFDFFKTGHLGDKKHKHSQAHSSNIEKKIVNDLVKQGKVQYL